MSTRRMLLWILGCLLTGMGAFFALAFYDRYWRWRDCFNELGCCFDPASQDVYLEQAGLVWGGLAAFPLLGGTTPLSRRSGRR